MIRLFERDIFPQIGKRPIAEVDAPELLEVLRRIEKRGAIDTAHRAQQSCGRVFRYAIVTKRAKRDPSADLRGALQPVKENHYPSIVDPKKIADLLRVINGYQGHYVTQCAFDEMTGHGFRSMASTILNEQGWNPDAIERQLAHAERNAIRAAYNYAEYLPERRKMMQHWADYLDLLVNDEKVLPLKAV